MNVGVLLAAGASSRMGSPKPLVKLKGQTFLAHGVRHLWAACDAVIVVLGANAAKVRDAAEEEFGRLIETGALAPEVAAADGRELEVHFIENRKWKEGQLSSARLGLAEACKLKPKGILVLPVDHPHLRSATVLVLAEMMKQALGAFGSKAGPTFQYALAPRHKGRRGHPLALSPALAALIAKDRVARDLADAVRRHARLVGYFDVADKGVIANVNTPARAAR